MESILEKEQQNNTTKELIMAYLEEVSKYYRETLIGFFIARLESKHDTQLTVNFNSYVATIITVYKIVKPKLDMNVDTHKELMETIEGYVDQVLEENKNVNIDTMIQIFQIFNIIEDALRKVTNSLGYTSDN